MTKASPAPFPVPSRRSIREVLPHTSYRRPSPTAFGFTGEQDGIAGLVYLRARFYDPNVGRFLTKDPFPGYASSPSTLNPYSYALNNPTSLVDPSGRNPLLIAAAVGAIIGMVGGAVSYMISNPGADLGDMLNSACFWKSVVIGGITGAVSGLFTGFLGGLGILGTNFIQTVVLGAFTGFISGGVGEIVNQLLSFGKITNWDSVLNSALMGEISGAIFSVVGYGVGKGIKFLAGHREEYQGAQELIDSIVENELSDVQLTHYPEYDPFLAHYGEAQISAPNLAGYTRVGPAAIRTGRSETLITILHEEMHHRLHSRGWVLSRDLEEFYVEAVALRFARSTGSISGANFSFRMSKLLSLFGQP